MDLKLTSREVWTKGESGQKTVVAPVKVPTNFRILQNAGSVLTRQGVAHLGRFTAWVVITDVSGKSLSAPTSRKHTVVQSVKALRYQPEGRRFESLWRHWNFSLTSFQPHCGPGVDSAYDRSAAGP